MDESARIQACFRSFVEGSLITHNFEDVLNLWEMEDNEEFLNEDDN